MDIMKKNRSRAGFTLIELLVVVAIIALLMAILMPALGKARDQAKTLKCASNMRSLGMGEMVYAAEYNGFGTPFCSDGGTGYSWNFWTYVLWKTTVQDGKAYGCELVIRNPSCNILYGNESVSYGGKTWYVGKDPFRTIGINASIAGTRGTSGMKLAAVKSPSSVVYIGERSNNYPLNHNTTSGQYAFTNSGGLWGAHPSGIPNVSLTNTTFADGHVETLRWSNGVIVGDNRAFVYNAQAD